MITPTKMLEINTADIQATDRETLARMAQECCSEQDRITPVPFTVLQYLWGFIVFTRSMGDLLEECSIQGFVLSADFWAQFNQAWEQGCVLINYDDDADSAAEPIDPPVSEDLVRLRALERAVDQFMQTRDTVYPSKERRIEVFLHAYGY